MPGLGRLRQEKKVSLSPAWAIQQDLRSIKISVNK
jgi:hypothetical protein